MFTLDNWVSKNLIHTLIERWANSCKEAKTSQLPVLRVYFNWATKFWPKSGWWSSWLCLVVGSSEFCLYLLSLFADMSNNLSKFLVNMDVRQSKLRPKNRENSLVSATLANRCRQRQLINNRLLLLLLNRMLFLLNEFVWITAQSLVREREREREQMILNIDFNSQFVFCFKAHSFKIDYQPPPHQLWIVRR